MGSNKCFDAAYPPATAPPGAVAVLGYVGRAGYTPHVWTPGEWRRFAHLRQFPAFLPAFANEPEIEADEAVLLVRALGWAEVAEPDKRVIVLDGETRQFPGWYERWAARVESRGYAAMDYGSLADVLGNAAYDVWAADWNGIPALEPGQTIHADQYAASVKWESTFIDLSVLDDATLRRGGVGPRHG